MYNCCRNRARFWHRDSNSGSLRYSSSFWPLVSLFLLVKANISHFVFSLDKMPNNCLESSLLNFNQTAALLSLVHLDGSYIEFSNLFFHMFINIMTCFFPPLEVENSERDGNIRPPDLPFEKSVCRSGSNMPH